MFIQIMTSYQAFNEFDVQTDAPIAMFRVDPDSKTENLYLGGYDSIRDALDDAEKEYPDLKVRFL